MGLFHLFDKKATSIAQQKRIGNVGVFFVFVLMISMVYVQQGEGRLPAILVLLAFMPVAIFIKNKYSYFCAKCGKQTQMLGKKLNYCPKCGGEFMK